MEPITDDASLERDISDEAFTDVKKFMQCIREDFLKYVDPTHPSEMHMLDDLIKCDVLSPHDVEEMGAPTQLERARKFWFRLNSVDPQPFAQACYPLLKKHYPHVVSDHCFTFTDQSPLVMQCLCHGIRQSTTPGRLADCFASVECCSFEEYEEIAKGSQVGEAPWSKVFGIFRRNRHSAALREVTARFIADILKVRVPADFNQVFLNGFPCSCRHTASTCTDIQADQAVPGPTSGGTAFVFEAWAHEDREEAPTWSQPVVPKDGGSTSFVYVKNLLTPVRLPIPVPRKPESKSSSSLYPNTTSDEDYDSACSASLCSEPMSEDNRSADTTNDCQSSQFGTRKAKDLHLTMVGKINSATALASSVRSFHRNIEQLEQLSSILSVPASDEAQALSSVDRAQLAAMKQKATGLHNNQKQWHEKATKIWKDHRGLLTRELEADVPLGLKSELRKRLHLLENEMKEALCFLKKSQKSLRQISSYCDV